MRGWTKDGTEVELMPHQEMFVRALLHMDRIVIPARGRGAGWSTVLATAARLDAANVPVGPPDPELAGLAAQSWDDYRQKVLVQASRVAGDPVTPPQ